MGWKCNKCGNTESFTEVNSIETDVTQEKETTRVIAIRDRYREEGALNVWCNKCDSEDISWVEVPGQSHTFLSSDKKKFS